MDSHVYSGYEVPPYYDSLLAKLIVWAPERASAIARSRVALDELLVEGIITNVPIHQALLANEAFLEGRMTNPSGRVATPDDVGRFVAFVVSEPGWHLNGAHLRFDGGAADAVT